MTHIAEGAALSRGAALIAILNGAENERWGGG
jgi:hypothetical protein